MCLCKRRALMGPTTITTAQVAGIACAERLAKRPLLRRYVPTTGIVRPRRCVVRASARAGPPPDYYDVLGVEPSADARSIKRAFRAKALKLHPDVNKAPDAEQKFLLAKVG